MEGRAQKIVEIIRPALDGLDTPLAASRSQWTLDIKIALDDAGRKNGNWICVAGLPADPAFRSGEWLYDMCWLTYQPDGDEFLLEAVLVMECEWDSNVEYLNEDFQKLLLARAAVRLMIFDGGDPAGAFKTASYLARQVAAFRDSGDDNTCLFAGWVADNSERGWSFRWYIARQGVAHDLGPSQPAETLSETL